jgi:hypothetical protein
MRYKDANDISACKAGVIFQEAGKSWVLGFDGADLTHPDHVGMPIVYYFEEGTRPVPSQRDMLFSTASEVAKWIRESSRAGGPAAGHQPRSAGGRNASSDGGDKEGSTAGSESSGSDNEGRGEGESEDEESDSEQRQQGDSLVYSLDGSRSSNEDLVVAAWLGEWNDECEFCDDGGELLLCFACCKVAHQRCLQHAKEGNFYTPAGSKEEPDWLCGTCWSKYSNTDTQ